MTVGGGDRGGGLPAALAARFTHLGPLATARPAPALGQALAGVGGTLVAAGAVLLAGNRWVSTGTSGLAVVLVGTLLVTGVVAIVRAPPPVAVAGVAASGVAAPALSFFVTAGAGFPSLREVALLAGALLAGLYGVGPWRGHTFHLSILVVAGWLVALSFGDFGVEPSLSGGLRTIGQAVSGAGAASMVVGVVYLGLGSWLHDEGLEGMATPFLGVAALALPLGAVVLLRDSAGVLRGVVALTIGAVVALVGARCRRRGTTWLGVALGALGVVALVEGLTDSPVVEAALVAAAGAGLVLLAPTASAVVGQPFRADPVRADDPVVPPTLEPPERTP